MMSQLSLENTEKHNFWNTDLFKVTTISLFAFLVSFLLANVILFPNQLLIGTVVNTLLIYSVLKFDFTKSLPIILLPSIGTLLSGILFDTFSLYLLYLIPFIWLGNLALAYIIKTQIIERKKNYWKTSIIAIFIKTFIIFIPTLAFVLLGVIPSIFLIPMSLIQLVTAISGMLIAKSVV